MPLTRLFCALGLLGLLLAADTAFAQDLAASSGTERFDRSSLPRDTVFIDGMGMSRSAVRCGTRPVDPEVRTALSAEVDRVLELAAGAEPTVREIPVVMHVIRGRKNGRRAGDVSDDRIDEQMRVLNESFRKAGVQFRLQRVNRVNKRRWYNNCARWYVEDEMKAKLAVNPASTLNIYTCDSDVLGYSWFPWDFPVGDPLHGVVVNHETLPGGSAAPQNEGDTIVHETGHYLGLLHTFDGGCSPGDEVADTAAEQSPAYGCPARRDTCSGGGPDPIDNFMDYTDDACMDSFSAGQAQRIQAMLATYRPGS